MSLFKNAAISILIGLGVTIIILAIGAATYSKFAYSSTYISIITEVAFVLGSFVSGFLCGKKNGKKGIVAGLSTGIPISLILLAVSFIFGNRILTVMLVITMAIVIIVGALGGIMSQNVRGNNRR